MSRSIATRPLPTTDSWDDREQFFMELRLAMRDSLNDERRTQFERAEHAYLYRTECAQPTERLVYHLLRRYFEDENVGCRPLREVLELCQRFVDGAR